MVDLNLRQLFPKADLNPAKNIEHINREIEKLIEMVSYARANDLPLEDGQTYREAFFSKINKLF